MLFVAPASRRRCCDVLAAEEIAGETPAPQNLRGNSLCVHCYEMLNPLWKTVVIYPC
jgi:hypothetical protein